MKTLLLSAGALVLASTPALAGGDASVCQSVAAQIRALPAPPYDASSDTIEAPIQRLADNRGSAVALDASAELTADQVGALDATLKSRFHAPAAVLTAVDALDPGEVFSVWIRRLGASNAYAVETLDGTMACEDFVFFDAPSGRAAKLVSKPPPGWSEFCTTGEGLPGQVGSTPVFIEQDWDTVTPVYDIEFAAWRGSAWAKPCSLHVLFRSTYRVAATDCHGDSCAALPAAALAMAERRQVQIAKHGVAEEAPATFAWGPTVSAAGRAKVKQLTNLLDDPPQLDVSSVSGDAGHSFADDAVIFPVMVGGQVYAAVLSHGGVGWRIYPDFLLSLYDLKAGAAERVASVHIVRDVGPAPSVKITD